MSVSVLTHVSLHVCGLLCIYVVSHTWRCVCVFVVVVVGWVRVCVCVCVCLHQTVPVTSGLADTQPLSLQPRFLHPPFCESHRWERQERLRLSEPGKAQAEGRSTTVSSGWECVLPLLSSGGRQLRDIGNMALSFWGINFLRAQVSDSSPRGATVIGLERLLDLKSCPRAQI